jgi:hypothetical protein
MRPLMPNLVAPPPKLGVQIVDVDKRARCKKGVPQVLDLSLDFPFLVATPWRTRPRREVIVPRELEQPRMKPNRGARAFEDGAAQIIVDQRPWNARPRLKGRDMAAEKALQRLVEGEEGKHGARVRQHHHKSGQRTDAAADADGAKGAPIDLRLFFMVS